eukprot:7579729-Ditylum_brightwellii.AAC.1
MFDLLSLLDGDKQIKNIITLTTNVKKVHKHLQSQDMLDCFMLVQPTPSGLEALVPQWLNLLAYYDTITKAQVAKSVEFFSKYGQDYDHKNID